MRAASAVFWSSLEAGVSAALSFVSAFVIARIVGPVEMGVGAAAVASHVLLWVGTNALFADAIVQRRALSDDDAASAFWASSLTGLLASLVQAAAGLVLARSLSDARLAPMGLLLALPLPLVGAGGVAQGMLTRRRAYRVLAARAIVGQGLGTAAGVAAALCGAGAWALALQQAVTSAIGALSLLIGAGTRPKIVFRWPAVRSLLRTGLPLAASTLVQQGRYRLFAMLIGVTAGPASLGVVHLAFRLADTVRDLASSALWRLLLPAMSERQHDVSALQAGVDRAALLSGLALFPAIGAMSLALRPLVALVLGPVWEPAAQAAAPLLLLMIWLFLGFPGGVAIVARGGARYVMFSQIATTVATLGGVLLLRPATPFAAVGIWSGAQLLVSPYVVVTTAKLMRAAPLRQQRAGLPALALAALATMVATFAPAPSALHGGIALVLWRIAVLAAVHSGGTWLLLRKRVRGAMRPWPAAA